MKISVDLRSALSLARDQGPRPTCISFATTAAHELSIKAGEHLAVEYLHYFAIKRGHGDFARGASTAGIQAALERDGQPPEAQCPYGSLKLGSSPRAGATPLFRRKVQFSPPSAADIISQLDRSRASILVLRLTEAFYRPPPDGRIVVSRNDKDVQGALHAVLAVGHGSDASGGFVLIRNSWGGTWGLDGHAWLSVPYLTKHMTTIGTLEYA